MHLGGMGGEGKGKLGRRAGGLIDGFKEERRVGEKRMIGKGKNIWRRKELC